MSKSPRWISINATLAIHARQIFTDGGEAGLRDLGLLESALSAPQHKHAYGESDPHVLAAAYAYAISRNHPFLDGNKRCSMIVAGVFLQLNGWRLEAEEAEMAHVALALAAGRLEEHELASWFRAASRSLAPTTARPKRRTAAPARPPRKKRR